MQKMRGAQKLLFVFLVLLAAATPLGLLVYMAISHNPQNRFIDGQGAVDWQQLGYLLVPGGLLGFVFAAFVAVNLLLVFMLVNRRRLHG